MGSFSKLHHICLVVRDVDRAMAFYEKIGIGPWKDYPAIDQFTTLEMPDVAGFKAFRIKVAEVGDVQFQLIEPGPGDTPQHRFLAEKGEGVFHVGFVVDDVDEGEAEAHRRGLKSIMRGRRDDGSGFAYFDTAAKAGVTLSIRKSPTKA